MWRGVPFRIHDTNMALTVPEPITLHTSARATTREVFDKTVETRKKENEVRLSRELHAIAGPTPACRFQSSLVVELLVDASPPGVLQTRGIEMLSCPLISSLHHTQLAVPVLSMSHVNASQLLIQLAEQEALMAEQEERRRLRKAAAFHAKPAPDLSVPSVVKRPPAMPLTKPVSPRLGRRKDRLRSPE